MCGENYREVRREWLMCLCGNQNENRGEAFLPKTTCWLPFRYMKAAAPVPLHGAPVGWEDHAREGCMLLPVPKPCAKCEIPNTHPDDRTSKCYGKCINIHIQPLVRIYCLTGSGTF